MIPETRGPERPPYLNEAELGERVDRALENCVKPGERVLCIVPDATRTIQLPFFFRRIVARLLGAGPSGGGAARGPVRALDFMVALGTHPPLDEAALNCLFGLAPGERSASFPEVHLLNHSWNEDSALAKIGSISAREMEELSGGLLSFELPVRVNRRALEYDRLLVCGPVFPHEVVGFSGGNKYFFPGISGPDVIDATHWLGALLTSYAVIGVKNTAVRRVINLAASLIPVPRSAICVVNDHHGVFGVFSGRPEEAWSEAADLAARTHIAYLDRPVRRVLSVLPEMYRELWVGSKGMYKLEPVVADGGEVIIYAPGLAEISVVHGALIREIGYHVRDYFTSRWARFKAYPWGILAHSTHLKGSGSYDVVKGEEHPRIRVTLSTAIPEKLCAEIGLGYLDPAGEELRSLLSGADPDTLVVSRAGETLYRLGGRRA